MKYLEPVPSLIKVIINVSHSEEDVFAEFFWEMTIF